MAIPILGASAVMEPLGQLAGSGRDGVLAIITGIDGPSYRPLGAMMAVFDAETWVGSLSSGCVEADVALHAVAALESGRAVTLRYGQGSPFVDIQLPCGGGLEITLIPAPDRAVMEAAVRRHAARETVVLAVDMVSGAIALAEGGETGREGTRFTLRIEPELFFYIFGKGPEASTFAMLAQSAGYPNVLLSPDAETLAAVEAMGGRVRHLTSAQFPADLVPDARSAVLLFFHDHEWEPPILARAVETPAFYIGSQGSQRAAAVRMAELEAMGVGDADLARIKGPIGLIPSVRDARKLAVSVLAEVLDEA